MNKIKYSLFILISKILGKEKELTESYSKIIETVKNMKKCEVSENPYLELPENPLED